MPLAIISLGILLLFFLIIVFRLNAFIAFIVVSLSVGIAQGMELNSIVTSIEEGVAGLVHISEFESEDDLKTQLPLGGVQKFKISLFEPKEQRMTLVFKSE